jgi:hypothetical protein
MGNTAITIGNLGLCIPLSQLLEYPLELLHRPFELEDGATSQRGRASIISRASASSNSLEFEKASYL